MAVSESDVKMFYRPTWTCGRYEKNSKTAIVFNLLSGLNFLFEDSSASVIGHILSVGRGNSFSLKDLELKTGLSGSTLKPFIFQLVSNGLLSTMPMSDDVILEYRKTQVAKRETKSVPYMEISNDNGDNVEKAYARRTKKRVIVVMLELTYNCSERCVHCYNPGAVRNDMETSGRNKFKELQIMDYKRIIDELYDEGLVKVCLSGGDPFSNSRIWEIVDYLYKKEIAFEIYTNGLRLYGQEQRLADYYPCNVGISIYGAHPQIHDAVTNVEGSFLKSCSVLNTLANLAVPLEIKCCLMKINVKDYLGVADIAKRYAAVFQLECAIFDSVDGDTCVSNYLRLSKEQMEIVLRDKNNPLYVGSELPDYGARIMDLSENGCGAGSQNFCITPTGNVVLCCNFHAKLGNLNKQHLSDILNDNAMLKYWENLTLRQYEECWKHDYCKYCKFCPGLNFAENGTPLKASENCCYIAKIRYGLVQKLMVGDDPLNGRSLKDALADLPDYEPELLHKIPTKSYLDTNMLYQ